jgi:hypothetical protein
MSVVVARSTARAAATAAKVAATADLETQCRAALRRALESWQIAALEEVEWAVRHENAGKARAGLIEVRMILGGRVRTADFDELVRLLAAEDEADLNAAKERWQPVQASIEAAMSER